MPKSLLTVTVHFPKQYLPVGTMLEFVKEFSDRGAFAYVADVTDKAVIKMHNAMPSGCKYIYAYWAGFDNENHTFALCTTELDCSTVRIINGPVINDIFWIAGPHPVNLTIVQDAVLISISPEKV